MIRLLSSLRGVQPLGQRRILRRLIPASRSRWSFPFAAGGPSDSIGRADQPLMSETLGQQIVIENVAGGGRDHRPARVSKSTPDGYTLLIHHVALSAAPRSTRTQAMTR